MYIVYKTTNLINNKIYVGVHYQEDVSIFDGYLGSNRILWSAIKKYGVENFKREIIEIFEHKDDAYEMESLIVDEEFVSRSDTYNISPGGIGNCNLGKNSVKNKLGMHSDTLSKEEKSNLLKNGHAKRDPNERLKTSRTNGKSGGMKSKELKLGFNGLDDEQRRLNAIKGGKVAGKLAVENESGIHGMSIEEKLENSRRGGLTQARRNKELGTGFYGISEEDRKINASNAGKISGQKRLGSKWYNDGRKRYSYTVQEQNELSFDEFLKLNPQYKKGTTLQTIK